MEPANNQPELPLLHNPARDTITINGHCTLRREDEACMVCVAGLAMHHWMVGDQMAERYAMVSLVQSGYADQNDVALAFGITTRMLRKYQRRYEIGGIAALGRTLGRPPGIQAEPSPWVRTAVVMKSNGFSVRDTAQRLKVSIGAVSKWLTRQSKLIMPSNQTTQTSSLPDTSFNEKKTIPISSVIHGKVEGWSLDVDPTNRALDRLLARMGKLNDAQPLFNPGQQIARAGVLLAVPALVQSGIFSTAQEVYGSIGPAFYGLRTTILSLLLLALLRIKRPEGLKEHVPADLGRLLGLDRAPEVKTLRRKLTDLAEFRKAELFGRKLAQVRVARRGRMIGFLYTDGHVRVYSGKRRIPKTYSTRMRMALPATTDYWVNDKAGDPVFVVTAEFNEALTVMLPKILEEVRRLVGKRRVTMVFDRGGWSPKLFVKLIQAGFDILTYRKGKWREIARKQFVTCAKTIEGRKISYELNDRNIRLLKGRLRLRQITRLSGDGHQTPIVTSRLDLPAVVLAYRMFERWRQENFFKYMLEEYEIDALADYKAESENPERLVPNPERRKLNKQLASAHAKFRKIQALYGEAVMSNKEKKRPTVRGFKIAHVKLGKQIQEIRKRVDALQARRDKMPKRIKIKELTGKPLVRLLSERKHLTNCIKMVAYQAESDLLALLRPHYARADQEGRTLITTALQSSADIEIKRQELLVTLAPLSSEHRSKAIAAMCETLNKMEICFPGSTLRLRFGVARMPA